jgi:hypothetical protein
MTIHGFDGELLTAAIMGGVFVVGILALVVIVWLIQRK